MGCKKNEDNNQSVLITVNILNGSAQFFMCLMSAALTCIRYETTAWINVGVLSEAECGEEKGNV